MGKAFGSPLMAPVSAVVLGLLALGASLADVPLAIARHQTGPGGPVVYALVTLAVAVPGTAVGVLLAARRPRNPIGWLLLALLLLAANPASDYAILDYRLRHGTLPLGWAAVLFLASSPAVPVLLAILLWVFPDGRLPGRWRPAAWALITAWESGREIMPAWRRKSSRSCACLMPRRRLPGMDGWASPSSGCIASRRAARRSCRSRVAGLGCSCPSTAAMPGPTP